MSEPARLARAGLGCNAADVAEHSMRQNLRLRRRHAVTVPGGRSIGSSDSDRAKSYVLVRTGTYRYILVHASTGFLE